VGCPVKSSLEFTKRELGHVEIGPISDLQVIELETSLQGIGVDDGDTDHQEKEGDTMFPYIRDIIGESKQAVSQLM
jgi:hypothetical protein